MAGLEVDGVEPVAGSFPAWLLVKWLSVRSIRTLTNCCDKSECRRRSPAGYRLRCANCRQGLRVAVATIGAVLPGDSKLKRRNCVANRLKGCCAPF